jgi:hypothetical protein
MTTRREGSVLNGSGTVDSTDKGCLRGALLPSVERQKQLLERWFATEQPRDLVSLERLEERVDRTGDLEVGHATFGTE